MRFALVLFLFTAGLFAQSDSQRAAESANAYAFNTFQLFRQITDGNFCYSPYSSQGMAALLVEGAAGDTANELIKLAGVPADEQTRLAQARALRESLSSSARGGGVLLEIANSIWAPDEAFFLPDYMKLASEQYGVVTNTYPAGDKVRAATAVNAWVRQRTRERITSLVSPALFTPNAVCLVNTVYLRASWSSAFDAAKTKPRPFTLPNGGTQLLPMMLQVAAFDYAESETWQCLELPFGAQDFSMTILLSRDAPSRQKVETGLSRATWQAVTGALTSCDVNVFLPRFSFSTELSMNSMWQHLGAGSVFSNGIADLSGMIRGGGYYVKTIVHQASIDVNEQGAEAAAATAVAAAPFGGPHEVVKRRKVSFVADHPFLWMITHRPSRLILFMGRFAGQ